MISDLSFFFLTCLLLCLPDQDGAEPMGNSVSASNLLRLAIVAGHSEWGEHAAQLLQAFGELLVKVPMAVPEMVCCLLTCHSLVKQVSSLQ